MATWKEMIKEHKELVNRDVNDFIQHPSGGWYENTAKITNSNIIGCGLVLNNANVWRSVISGYARVEENVEIYNSYITERAIIKGDCHIDKSLVTGVTTIGDDVAINNSEISGQIIIDGKVTLDKCIVSGKTTIRGMCQLEQCLIVNSLIVANWPEKVKMVVFNNDTYTKIPFTISDKLLGYPITINEDKMSIGCQTQKINQWLKEYNEWNRYLDNKKNLETLIDGLLKLKQYRESDKKRKIDNGNMERNG